MLKTQHSILQRKLPGDHFVTLQSFPVWSWLCRALDIDYDGFVSRDELRRAMKNPWGGAPLLDSEFDSVWAQVRARQQQQQQKQPQPQKQQW